MGAKPAHVCAHRQIIAGDIGLTGWQFKFCKKLASSVRRSRIEVPICLLIGFPGAVSTVLLITSPMAVSV